MVTPGNLKRRAEVYHQIGTSIQAGLPLVKALQMGRSHLAFNTSHRTMLRLVDYLGQGHTLRDSIHLVQTDANPGVEVALSHKKTKFDVPVFDLALLGVGEETGRLDQVFKQLGEYYKVKAEIISKTISDMITTFLTLNVFLLVFPVALLVSGFWGFFDGDYRRCLPFIIEKLVAFGSLYGGIYLLIFLCSGTRSDSTRYLVEGIALRVPVLGVAWKNLSLARFTTSLESLVNAGVPVVRSWELAAATSGSPRLNREVQAWSPRLETGMTPADMVNQISYFPETFANLYATGEVSGKIDDTLVRLRDYYSGEGFRTLQMFTRMMNWTIYFIIVLLIAGNIIRFWIGYYQNMINTINNA